MRATERVMLGLRLDEPVALAGLEHMLDAGELGRLERLGLAERGDGSALTGAAASSATASPPACSPDERPTMAR